MIASRLLEGLAPRSLPSLRLALTLVALCSCAPQAREPSDIDRLIPWLLSDERRLNDIAFASVIAAATGRKVLPVDNAEPGTRRVLATISKSLDEVLQTMNSPGAEVSQAQRINEASRFFEDALQRALDGRDGLACTFPPTAAGRVQRSGYPDLRVYDSATERVYYLDPKLYARGSRDSTFRTFYYEPKRETNKVLDDACHMVVEIEHAPRADGLPRFERWELIDLSGFRVKLKAEFEGSNVDMFRPEAIVAAGPAGTPSPAAR